MKIDAVKTTSKTSFGSISIEDYNSKYSSIRQTLRTEAERFASGGNNARLIGSGMGGETFRFSNAALSNLVIKRTKPGHTEDYSTEYKNLMAIPTDRIGGQEAVARLRNLSRGSEYYLVSTLVPGQMSSVHNRYNSSHMRSLFEKMFQLDKDGIYHGDLNGKNILLTPSGTVNFIDYQWTQIVPKSNFYDNTKVERTLLPLSHFPENAQMFEMASMPYYIENLPTNADKEEFMRMYLRHKAEYHSKRYEYIKKITQNWPYSSERAYIQESLKAEKAKAQVYAHPDDSVIKLELKKLQFLSDYRDAYSHVDANLPDRNIIPSSSTYLCSISSVQDYRKEVARQMRSCYDSTKMDYLRSMETYGDFWYRNLCSYTSDTFAYVMRAITKQLETGEDKFKFYINERNPREFTPARELLETMRPEFRTVYESNFSIPMFFSSGVETAMTSGIRTAVSTTSDQKSLHHIDKVRNITRKISGLYSEGKYLDLLNATQLATLKVREFKSYSRHNLNSYRLDSALNSMYESIVTSTNSLFDRMLSGLKSISANGIVVQGYKNMRQFTPKL